MRVRGSHVGFMVIAILGLILPGGKLVVGILFVDMRSFRSMRYCCMRTRWGTYMEQYLHGVLTSRWLLIWFLLFQSRCILCRPPTPVFQLVSLSSCTIATSGQCRIGVGSCPGAGERLMAYSGCSRRWGSPIIDLHALLGSHMHANETTMECPSFSNHIYVKWSCESEHDH